MARRDRAFRWRAHPRTGGEHAILVLFGLIVTGSPPHGRGTQPPSSGFGDRRRLTPARAGNTSSTVTGCNHPKAHPRTGGEHGSAAAKNTTLVGSPPHGRGTRVLRHECILESRLTPARAGNTDAVAGSSSKPPAHPRTGGEHFCASSAVNARPGSPPHGRGTRQRAVGGGCQGGLTPARAGNTARVWT